MKIQICVQCKTEIPIGACQQSQKIDGVTYPLHIGCADAWAEEQIAVWTLSSDHDGFTIDSLECVKQHVENMDADDEESVEITARKMKRIDFLKLPEAQ